MPSVAIADVPDSLQDLEGLFPTSVTITHTSESDFRSRTGLGTFVLLVALGVGPLYVTLRRM